MLGGIQRSSNSYGRLLLLKIGLFAFMVALAAANRFLLVPRLTSRLGDRRALRLLSATILIEQVAGAAVLLDVAVLGLIDPRA